jgi:hypothetical protein
MIFITVTRPAYRGHEPNPITIRGDHILQMTTNKDGATWLLIERTGWLVVVETRDQIKDLIRQEQQSALASPEPRSPGESC